MRLLFALRLRILIVSCLLAVAGVLPSAAHAGWEGPYKIVNGATNMGLGIVTRYVPGYGNVRYAVQVPWSEAPKWFVYRYNDHVLFYPAGNDGSPSDDCLTTTTGQYNAPVYLYEYGCGDVGPYRWYPQDPQPAGARFYTGLSTGNVLTIKYNSRQEGADVTLDNPRDAGDFGRWNFIPVL